MEISYIAKETGKKWLDETVAISPMIGGLIKSKKNDISNKEKK